LFMLSKGLKVVGNLNKQHLAAFDLARVYRYR
jgi:hypothetical protein